MVRAAPLRLALARQPAPSTRQTGMCNARNTTTMMELTSGAPTTTCQAASVQVHLTVTYVIRTKGTDHWTAVRWSHVKCLQLHWRCWDWRCKERREHPTLFLLVPHRGQHLLKSFLGKVEPCLSLCRFTTKYCWEAMEEALDYRRGSTQQRTSRLLGSAP